MTDGVEGLGDAVSGVAADAMGTVAATPEVSEAVAAVGDLLAAVPAYTPGHE